MSFWGGRKKQYIYRMEAFTKLYILALFLCVFVEFVPTEAASLSYGTTCTSSEYFDIGSLNCVSCGTKAKPTLDGLQCQCAPPWAGTFDASGVLQCTTNCTVSDKATSQDGTTCIACNTTLNKDPAVLDCTCTSTEVIVEKDTAGNYLSSKTCAVCPLSSIPSAVNRYICTECGVDQTSSGSTCSCISGYTKGSNGMCYPTVALTGDYEVVKYQDVVSVSNGVAGPESFKSSLFSDYYASAMSRCTTLSDRESCQTLGNLCTFQTYEKTTVACTKYEELATARKTVTNDQSDWPATLPWLYYSDGATVLTSNAVKLTATFSTTEAGKMSTLSYILARYAINGTFIGYTNLTDQIQWCQGSIEQLTSFLRFGTSVVRSCYLDLLKKVIQAGDPELYDLYLVDSDSSLFPVPVRVLNYRASGVQVNVNPSSTEEINDQLTRRFFMYDNVSGKKVTGASTDPPSVIRYAKSMTLKVLLQKGNPGHIYPPILEIEYAESATDAVMLSVIEEQAYDSPNSRESFSTPSVSFSMQYTMSMDEFLNTAQSFLIVVLILAFFGMLFSSYYHMKRNQRQAFEPAMVFYLFQHVSTALFFLLAVLAWYFWLFFKAQSTVYILLPEEGSLTLTAFSSVLIIAFISKILHVMYKIYRQCQSEVFFMDWEKSRGNLFSGPDDPEGKPAPVSIWRTLFVANEWNELQITRKLHFEFSIFLVLFFLEGLKLIYLATPQPDSRDLSEGTTNSALRFGITSFFWLAVASIQLLWKFLIKHRLFANPFEEFVDLLSVANISAFVLGDRLHGYYLHGRSPHAFADTSKAEMASQLKKEEESHLVPTRGLRPDSQQQATEVFITQELRQQYDDIYAYVIAEQQRVTAAQQGQVARLTQAKKSSTGGTAEAQLVAAYSKLNKFLIGFIDQTDTEHEYLWRERTFFERLLDVPPDMEQVRKSQFIDDPDVSFKKLFLYGMEYDLLLFDILIYSVVDFATQNSFIAAIVTYLGQKFLDYWRARFGESNLSRRALIDTRFLF